MPAYRAISYETPNQSVFIATPAYESVKAGYALSLAKTVEELTRRGIPRTINILFGNCHVDDGRNDLVRDFLDNTQCTDLIFIDADVMWEPDAFLRLIQHDTTDIVAGAYPFKSNSGMFPVGKIVGGQEGGKGKAALLSVSYAPTGFMRIPRSVFEKLSPDKPTSGKLDPSRRFFERRYTDRTYDGGDVTFCRKWIAEGGQVYIDPSLKLAHIGEHIWHGDFAAYLQKPEHAVLHTVDSKDPVPDYRPDAEAIPETIKEMIANPDTATLTEFKRLAAAYGNKPFAATPEFLNIAWMMAKALPENAVILECGSGLSTIVLAATGHKVICIEDQPEWAEKTDALLKECGLDADIKVTRMNGEWYAGREALFGINAPMVVIDGPRRTPNMDRLWPLRNMDKGMVSSDAAVMVDDYHALPDTIKGEFLQAGSKKRPFIAGRLHGP